MPRRVQCPLCGEQFPCATGDTSGRLLRHLHDQHSQVSVAAYSVSTGSYSPDHVSAASQLSAPYRSDGDRQERQGEQRSQACPYREGGRFSGSARPRGRGLGKVSCNSCGRAEVPLARRQGTKDAHSPLATLCALACWPLCLLPCCGPDVVIVNLFCPRCRHYMGTYDARDGRLQRPPTAADVAASGLESTASESSVSSRDDSLCTHEREA